MLSKEVYLIKYDELFLKSRPVRERFIAKLIENIKKKTNAPVKRDHARIVSFTKDPKPLSKIFGISSYAKAIAVKKDIESIWQGVKSFIGKEKTFAVRAKRSDKTFPLTSKEIEVEIGSRIHLLGKKVNLTNPEKTYYIDISKDYAYTYTIEQKGLGGLPVGTGGKALLMFSGGFDSSASALLMAKRGVIVDYLYFDFAGPSYRQKIYEIYNCLKEYTFGKFYVVDFSNVVSEIINKVKKGYKQAVLKRKMYRAAIEFAKKKHRKAIVTGENLAQVSTQTLTNLNLISKGFDFLVLRPVLAYNKKEIIDFLRPLECFSTIEHLKETCEIDKKANPSLNKDLLNEEQKVSNNWKLLTLEYSKEQRITVPYEEAQDYIFEKDKKYVIVCDTGFKARELAKRLREKGYDVIGDSY